MRLKRERKVIDTEPSVDLHAYLCCSEAFPSQLVPLAWLTRGSAVTDGARSCFRLTDGCCDRLWSCLKTDSPRLCVLPQPFYSAASHARHG